MNRGAQYGRLDNYVRSGAAKWVHHTACARACHDSSGPRPAFRQRLAGIPPFAAGLCQARGEVGSKARAEAGKLEAIVTRDASRFAGLPLAVWSPAECRQRLES